MPQLQIIGREQDSFADSLNRFAETTQNRILKKQALELTKRELELKVKAAQTEAEKLQAERLKQVVDISTKINEGELKGPAAGVVLKRFLNAAGLTLDDFNEGGKIVLRNFNELARTMAPGADEATPGQARFAKSQRDTAEASQLNATTRLINNISSAQGANTQPGLTQTSSLNKVDGQVPIENQARADAVSSMSPGRFDLMSINAGPTKFVNLNATANLEALKKRATEQASQATPKISSKRRDDIVGVMQQKANIRQLEELSKKVEGAGPLIGKIAAGVGGATGGRANPIIRRYLKKRDAFAAGLYRDLTGDKRLSDRDASERAKPLIWDPTIDAFAIRKDMFSDIKRALDARERMLRNGNFFIDPKTGSAITPLESVLKNANRNDEFSVGRFKIRVKGSQ